MKKRKPVSVEEMCRRAYGPGPEYPPFEETIIKFTPEEIERVEKEKQAARKRLFGKA